MGLEPKGRAFYWRTPSGSNGCFLKCGGDLAPKPRAQRTAPANFSKAIPVGYDAWPPQGAHPSKKHAALLLMSLEDS